MPAQIWHEINYQFEDLKNEFKITGEIKWRFFPINLDKKQNSLSHLNREQRDKFRTKLYSMIRKQKSIKSLCVSYNTVEYYNSFWMSNAEELYINAYRQIFSAFNQFLEKENSNGIMICDQRNSKQDEILRNFHTHIVKNSSPFFLGSKENRIIENVLITPSHHSVGIQLADMVLGSVLLKSKNGNERFYKQVEQSFVHHEGINGIIPF